jgi:predicted nucleotidyltransferase
VSLDLSLCKQIMAGQPYPLLFATVSGAHLYGFPSPDSDYDLRGVHVLPAREVVGLGPLRETVESEGVFEGVEIDLVTHDVTKFMRLMLKKNGYVLEQLLSPLIVQTTPEHEELKALAAACITKNHGHHYLGFAETQWGLFTKETPARVKPLLYVYRVLLTGIQLMRTGKVEANLVTLNREFGLAHIGELVARKTSGAENQAMSGADTAFHEGEYRRLVALLEEERDRSSLPEVATGMVGLNELLVRLRLREGGR